MQVREIIGKWVEKVIKARDENETKGCQIRKEEKECNVKSERGYGWKGKGKEGE